MTAERIDQFDNIFEILKPTAEEKRIWRFAFANAFVEPFIELILENRLYRDFVYSLITYTFFFRKF